MIRPVAPQRILSVDLTRGETRVEIVPEEEVVKYLGGRGIAAKLLFERVRGGSDPLGPDNALIIGTGTLTGTNAPSCGRTSMLCKSPATGLYLKVSVGGHLGAELRYAGWDYLVMTGRSPQPVYLWIADDRVDIRPAGHLWGQGTRAADARLKEELGDPGLQTAVIGPAGENGVLFAAILCSRYNGASRGGIGAVMGSKNLKAIAVQGGGGLRVAEGKPFYRLADAMRHELAKDSGTESFTTGAPRGRSPA